MNSYREFFTASAGASAAFIGLLFVALSFITGEAIDERVKNWRRIMASSSFAQLIDIFFVSLVALTPDPRNMAITSCVMAIFGVIASARLFPRTIDRSVTGRNLPTAIGVFAVAVYLLQFFIGFSLLHSQSEKLYSYMVIAIVLLYAGALARAWEITGIKER